MKSENKSKNTNDIQFIDGTNNYINNKMKRQGYTEDVGYEYGYNQEDESPIKKIIIAGAITAGGIVAYKKGYLKRGISQLISYANDYKAISPTAFKTFRDWVKGKDAETATLKNSIFRTKNIKTFFNALKEDSVKDDTFADFANLKSSFKANIAKTKREHMHGAKRVYDNTDLIYDIKDANKILKPFNTTVKKQIVRNKINEDLIKQYTQTSDDIAKQLKRTGYRKAQLGDILEYRKDANGKFGLFNINDDVNVDENTIATLLDFIENTTLENGKRVADTDLWKHMILDKNILFSENGKFSDLRQAYNSFSLFARSLSTDFQIPFVGLNPLEYTALSKMGLRKPKFGLLGAETIQPHFTKKTGDYTLRDMFKITDDVVVSNHKAYAFIDNEFKEIGDNIELLSVDPNKYGISKDLNSFKKIANIKMRKYEEYNPKNIVDKVRFAIGKRLDIGRVDDSKRQFDDGPYSFFSRTLDPDEKIEGISNKLFNKLFSTAYKREKNIYTVFGEGTKDDSFRRFYYVGVQQRKTMHDVALDPNKNEAIVEYFKQFLYGRNDLDKVNKGSLKTYYLFERMNQSLNGFGLSLSQDSLGSTFDVLKNLTLKRFLPVYGGYQAIQYLNFLTEREKDEDGGENNISTFIGDKAVKVNIGLHNLENKLGITKFAKELKELTPGSDQITELPGINTLKLGKTGEEMAEYYQKGMDPVRKGRYWQLGNTPFTGGKIDFYRPNWYRRLKADADFSEVKYGSRKEYFENAWFPTPTAPLAPLRHFIKDKYHYEEMHYNDRPYLVTAPEFYDVPFVGPVVSSTLGEIVKPQKRMHDEYWNSKDTNTITNNTSSNVNALMYGVDNIKYDITIPKYNFNMQTPNVLKNARTLGNINMSSPLITNNQIQVIKSNNRFGTSTNNFSESFNSINIPKIQQDTSISNFNNSDFLTSKQINDYSAYINTSDSAKQLSDKIYTKQKLKEYNENKHISTIGTFDDTNQSKTQANVYTTASGSHQVVNVDNSKFKHIRKELNVKSIKQIPNTNLRANVVVTDNKNKGILDYNNGELQLSNNVTYDIENSKSMKQTFINQYQNAAEVLGIYGFTSKAFVVGDLGTNNYIIENPRQAYSFNDKFWEQNLGGLGGDLSEIFRRLIQKERKDQNKINPIRNTMPNWMPGENYFTDFKHGDPYSKIQVGELRLQGTPYEQLWGIQDPLKLQIGSSNIGKDVDSIVNHYLHNDTITDSEALDIVDSGTKTHNALEKKWIKSGLAIDTEIKVQDTQNNIIGFYDARIHDKSSKTGEAIVDIKTTNDKTFNKIKSTGIPKIENARQLNYYLWATGNDKGYLYYINRDTDESYTVTVNFDEKMLQDTFDNLNQARNKIMNMYNNGEISRGDLYNPIDRYRILADVAPYSQEFQNMKAILQSSGMDDETKKEYNEINKRMQQQKQANRTYEYKFKYAELDTYKTKITKVDGSSIYVDFNGKERKVNLAGIANGDIVQNKEVLDKKQEIEKYLTKGSKVTLKVNADELTWDKTKGIKAILIDKKGTNINKELVKQGVKVYDKDDNSPTSINVKYNSAQRAFGNIWERIAHMDTYFNTKFLNVRSAKEDYERKDVYGKSWQTWTHPIRDYLIPSIQRDIARPGGLLVGTAAGAMVGSMFGKTKFGSIIGGVAGGATVAIGKLFTKVYEIKNDKKWIPKRRRDERELNEYIDNLKYVKYIRYYNYYKQKALKEDGFNVDNYLRGKQSQASKRKKQISSIENVKIGLKEDYKKKKEKRDELKKPKPLRVSIGNIDNPVNKNAAKLFNKASKFINDKIYDLRYGHRKKITAEAKQKVTNANAEINTLKNHREIETLPLNATKAIQYYDMAKKTMRGYQPGDPITNILSALPKKERDRMKYFMKAPKQEREGILNIVPDYVKRPLQSIYGMKPDEQEPLEEYFTKHQLPGADWKGWNENVNLDNVKVKIVNREGYDESEFNIWQQDKDNAIAQGPIALPSVNFRSKAADIKRNLSDVLGNMGISNLNISYIYDTDDVNIDMDLNYDRSDDIEEEISNTDFV